MMTKTLIVTLPLLGVLLAGCATKTSDSNMDQTNALATQLHAAYHDQPFMGGQQTPDHEWTWIDSSHTRLDLLHWMPMDSKDKETGGDAEKADILFAVGDGFKGKWCKGDGGITQDQIDAGYVHFHKESSANWDAGHGGTDKSQVGYWLRHIAVKDGVTMGSGPSVKGQMYPLMPTHANLPDC